MLKYAAAVAVLSMPCFGGEGVHLVYKFNADAPTRYEMTQGMKQSQVVQGMEMETNSTTTSITSTELLDVNEEGSILIQTTTESIIFTLTAPGVTLSYDSNNPADQAKLGDPTVASLAGTVGMKLQLLIAPDGTVLDVPNMKDISAITDGMQDEAVKAGAEISLEKETIIATNEMNYKLLPTETVEAGDQWHRDFDVPMAGIGVMTTSFDLTLDSVKDGIASISITGSMTMPPFVQDGISTSLSSTEVQGIFKFNIEDGVADFYDLTTIANIAAGMEGMPDPIFTMIMNQQVTIKRLKD